ncbi:MAG: PAS domain S-box protein [Bacteroidia bacterium]|nr:PAS domain S-box protein [Bacteroidia bacterium]
MLETDSLNSSNLDYSSILFAQPVPVLLFRKNEEEYRLQYLNSAAKSLFYETNWDENRYEINNLFSIDETILSKIDLAFNSGESILYKGVCIQSHTFSNVYFTGYFSFPNPAILMITLTDRQEINDDPEEVIQFKEYAAKQVELQNDLIKSSSKLNNILQHLPVGLSIKTKDDKATYFNESFTHITGYTVDDVPDMETWFLKAFPNESYRSKIKQEWIEKEQKARSLGVRCEPMRAKVTCKDGTERVIERIVSDLDEEVVTIYSDITEMETAKNTIKYSEARFKAITEQTDEGIGLTDLNGNYIFVNPSMCKMVGYSEEELLKMNVRDLRVPEALEKESFKKVLRAKSLKISQLPLLKKDKSIIIADIKGKVITINGENVVLGVINDVSKQVEREIEFIAAKEHAEENEFRLKLAAETAQLGIWEWKIKEDLLIWDQKMFEIHGHESDELENKFEFWKQSLHPEDKERVLEELSHSLNKTGKLEGSFRIIRGDGQIAHIKVIGQVLRNEMGEPIRMIGINQDITEQVQAEEELKKSEDKFTALVYYAADAIFMLDENGYITNANLTASEWFQYSKEEFIGMHVSELHLVGPNEFTLDVWNKLKVEMNLKDERVLQRKDGSLLEVEINRRVLPDGTGAIAIARDISERKLAELKLIRSEEKQRALIENIGDTIILVNKDLKVVYQSPNYIYTAGIHLDEVKDKTVVDLVYEPDRQKVNEIIQEALMFPNKPMPFQTRVVNVHGNPIWIEGNIKNMLDNESVSAFIVNYRDITERTESELELQVAKRKSEESELRLNEAQFITKVGSWETDLSNLDVIWSEETFHIFEVDPKKFDPSHQAFLSFVHPDDIEKVDAAFRSSFYSNTYNTIEHKIITSKGNLKFIEERWKIVFNENGKPMKAVGTCQDISERKKIEEERAFIINDLIQRNRELEQFSYIVSHNLRAPVTNILGITDYMEKYDVEPDEQLPMLNGLNKSAQALDSVIHDLNYILQKKRELNLQTSPVSFTKMVDEIKLSIAKLIQDERVTIKTNFEECDEMLTVKSYLHSIFYNLITNSIKYKQSTVNPIIEIQSKWKGKYLVLTFKDNGLGIDLAKKGDQLFMLYKRFHFHKEGKGMGLFMVKSQVESLGGKISVSSEVNKGTEFTIHFPLQNN